MIREYRMARGRMEAEFQRRKEQKNVATNFRQARGFVRTCWKTKNWDPNRDPTQNDSSTDSEDEEDELDIENRDKFDAVQKTTSNAMESPHNNRNISFQSSEGRDNFDNSVNGRDLNSSHERTREMSNTKTRRKLFTNKPEIIEINDVQDEGSSALGTLSQLDTLQAIKDYNKSLPLRRRNKDSLPEIKTYNVAKIHRVKKDYKKDKTELETIYKPIGITDQGITTDSNNDKFSIASKTRAIQRS